MVNIDHGSRMAGNDEQHNAHNKIEPVALDMPFQHAKRSVTFYVAGIP
jgi:hypothetical protein